MRRVGDNRGTTLIELMIVMAILGFITIVMFSSFTTMIKHSMRTRVSSKTAGETLSVVWPLFKEVESAGFGVPSTGTCTPSIAYSSGTLTIHSTASGDDKGAGTWSFIYDDNCTVDNSSTSIPDGEFVVVINPYDKSLMSSGQSPTMSGNTITHSGSCSWNGMIAYWIPSTGGLDCYETSFKTAAYSTGTMPNLCEPSTQKLTRSVSTNAGSASFQPMMDCVLSLQYMFGCIYKSTGALTWRTDTSCTAAQGVLKFVKVGLVVQESPKTNTMGASAITLFQDLPSPVTITLTTNQRYYRWRVIERTIPLRNL